MRPFFHTVADIQRFLLALHLLRCPVCGAGGCFIRFGYRYWQLTPQTHGIRLWRIHCKRSPRRAGCGKTFGLRLGEFIPRHMIRASELWAFLRQLPLAPSVKAAWERARGPGCLENAYRLLRRIHLCQSILRTRLCARAPPPKEKTGVPLRALVDHLQETFGPFDPIRLYQEQTQMSFLATS